VTGSGGSPVSADVTGRSWVDFSDNACWSNAPVRYEVVAHARRVGDGVVRQSPPSSVALPVNGICAPEAILESATPNADGTVTVQAACRFPLTLPSNVVPLLAIELADGKQENVTNCHDPGGGVLDRHTLTLTGLPRGTDQRFRIVTAGDGDGAFSSYTTVHIAP